MGVEEVSGKTSRLEIRVDSVLKRGLEKIAKEMNVTVSDIIRDLIEIYVVELGGGNIKKIIREALRTEESRYLLTLEEYHKLEGFEEHRSFKVLHGTAEVIELEQWGDQDRWGAKYVIVPTSIPVIVHEMHYDATRTYEESLHIFTREGWKYVRIK